MSEKPDTSLVTIDEQIKEIKRELGLRARVYRRWIEAKKMTDVQAAIYTLRMHAVLDTLERVRAESRPELQL